MTDRDTFAAAALTGLLVHANEDIDEDTLDTPSDIACTAYQMADAMLRERANHIPDAGKMVGTPRTPQSDRLAEWERHGSHRWGLGVASDLYDLECRVAAIEKANHDAAPAARATKCGGTSHDAAGTGKQTAPPCVETDGLSPGSRSELINRTPERESPRRECGESSRRDVPQQDNCRAAGGPAHNTPATQATPRECTEPVAWAVCCPGDGPWSPCFFHEPHAQRHASAIFGSKNIVPLYRKRQPTLTATEAETLRELRDEAAQYADEIGLCSSEVRARQMIIDGLLERLG